MSIIAQPVGEEMNRHLNAPPLRQNQDRAVWGTALLTGGVYVANSFMVSGHILRVGYAEKSIKHDELDYLVVRATGLAIKFETLDPEARRAMDQYLDDLEPL